MSSDLMLDFVNPSMMSKEAGDISIDQDGEWGKIRFLYYCITSSKVSVRKECLCEATYMYIVIFHLLTLRSAVLFLWLQF